MPQISHTYLCMSALICAVMTCSDASVPTWCKCICMRMEDILCCSVAILLPSATAANMTDVCLFVCFQG